MQLILLAATQAATLAIWEELLAHVGYSTITSQSVRKAQHAIEFDRPNLLLTESDLDWYGAGLDLLHMVRLRPETVTLPVVLYASNPRWLRMQQRQLDDWDCHILTRPFTAADLWNVVATALNTSRLRERVVGC